MAILVEFPACSRPFALPILVALYRDQATNARDGSRYNTPAQLMCGLLCLLMRWFPERNWRFTGDGSYGTHEFARFAYRHRKRLCLVSRFFADANLYAKAPLRKAGTHGRPRKKGHALAKPAAAVARCKAKALTVRWYGGGYRRVQVVSGKGGWFKGEYDLVQIQWVFVRDLSGTHRHEYFFSTDTNMSAKEVIELYGARWNIETTFQELRSHMGLETTRGWSRSTVLRMAPCLIILYTLVVLFYSTLRSNEGVFTPRLNWRGKSMLCYNDMILDVRAYL